MKPEMYHSKPKYNSLKGQTVIEAAIALSAILLVLAAIAVVILTSLNNSEFIRRQSLAAKYSQQGLERLRFLRNNDITTFNSYIEGSIYCMGEDEELEVTPGGCQVNISNTFIRSVILDKNAFECNNEGTLAEVNVAWSSGRCSEQDRYCHSSKIVSCFMDQTGGVQL